jgi:hypothetical protein
MLVVTSFMLIAHSVLPGFGHVHGAGEATAAFGPGDTTLSAFLGIVLFLASVMELGVVIQLTFWLRSIHRRKFAGARRGDSMRR